MLCRVTGGTYPYPDLPGMMHYRQGYNDNDTMAPLRIDKAHPMPFPVATLLPRLELLTGQFPLLSFRRRGVILGIMASGFRVCVWRCCRLALPSPFLLALAQVGLVALPTWVTKTRAPYVVSNCYTGPVVQ